MSAPDRPTREQAAHPGSRMVGESYKDHSARAFGMLRAAEVDLLEARAEVRALRAELEALDDAAAAVTVSGRRWAAHATILRREREEAREALGLEMGMRTAAVDELETLRRRLWALLDADQLSDDDTVDRLRAALAARTPQPAGVVNVDSNERAYIADAMRHGAGVLTRLGHKTSNSADRYNDARSEPLNRVARHYYRAADVIRDAAAAYVSAPLPAVPDGEDALEPDAADPDDVRQALRAALRGRDEAADEVEQLRDQLDRAHALNRKQHRELVELTMVPPPPFGEDVPARLDAAADALAAFPDDINAKQARRHLRRAADWLNVPSPGPVRAAVAAALARPTERER